MSTPTPCTAWPRCATSTSLRGRRESMSQGAEGGSEQALCWSMKGCSGITALPKVSREGNPRERAQPTVERQEASATCCASARDPRRRRNPNRDRCGRDRPRQRRHHGHGHLDVARVDGQDCSRRRTAKRSREAGHARNGTWPCGRRWGGHRVASALSPSSRRALRVHVAPLCARHLDEQRRALCKKEL